jgi:hypothetical protein
MKKYTNPFPARLNTKTHFRPVRSVIGPAKNAATIPAAALMVIKLAAWVNGMLTRCLT